MTDKPWYQSKTKWGSLFLAASIIVPRYDDPQAWAEAAGVVLGVFGIRDAVVRK